jgi:cytochrome c oxidase cbb3-type subunit 3
MTDDYWIHGAGMSSVAHIIKVGVPAKGMISWRATLKEQQILEVGSYILTLHGTNPANGKKPQGEKAEYPLVQ